MNNLILPSRAIGMMAALSISCAVAESVITLKTGESLPVKASSLQNRFLTIQSPLLSEPIEFQIDSLKQLSTSAALSVPDQSAVITLHNGDTLYGALTALEENSLRLVTAWGAQLSIDRNHVKHIGFKSQKAYLRNATDSLKGWTSRNNNIMPECRDGYWITSKTNNMNMSTEKQLPEQIHVQCTIYHTTGLSFNLSLWENDQSGPGSKVDLLIATDRVELNKIYQGQHQNLGRITRVVPQNWYSNKNVKRSDIDFYANWKKDNYYLYINGEHIATWNNRNNDNITEEINDVDTRINKNANENEQNTKTERQFKPGDRLSIYAQDEHGMALTQLNVLDWNGAPPALQSIADPVSKYDSTAPKDKVFLLNGDVLRGNISLVEGGSMRVTSDHYDLIIPTTKIHSLEQPRKTKQKLPADDSDVRVFLTDQSVLSMTIGSIDGDMLHGHSPSTNNISIPLSTLRTIQFNLRDPELQKQRISPFVTQ